MAKKRKPTRTKYVKGSFNLPIQTVTIVPSTTARSKKIAKSTFARRVAETRRALDKLFGGSTTVRGVGSFLLKGKVIRERVVLVTAFATRSDFRAKKASWIRWVRAKGKQWKQESMGIIIENDLKYV